MIDIRSSKKIVILGDSSSGKSVLAKFLSEKLDIPNISIDESLFDSNGNKISDAILENKIQAVLIQDSWIIEGNSFPVLLEERIRGADTVIFFDMTPLVSLWNVFKRDIKSLFGVEREGYKS